MIAAIMQPTYLPWIGYFALMDQAASFVFLVDVQFEKQSWQQRNQIRTSKGLEWLSVPVFTKGRSGQKLMDVELVNPADTVKRHSSTIQQAYARAPFFSTYGPDLLSTLERGARTRSLAQLNITLIRFLAQALGIDSDLRSSKEFSASEVRTRRLVDLTTALGAHTYLSPFGSLEYIAAEPQRFASANVRLAFQNYEHPRYDQLHEPFISHSSVLDLLFMEGPDALEIIRSGTRDPQSLEDALMRYRSENGVQDA